MSTRAVMPEVHRGGNLWVRCGEKDPASREGLHCGNRDPTPAQGILVNPDWLD